MNKLAELHKFYAEKKAEIKKRLQEFKSLSKEKYFEELCFCLCTPQSSARKCWAAVLELKRKNLLRKGSVKKVADVLKKNGVRFHNNKAKYIVEARGLRLEACSTTNDKRPTTRDSQEPNMFELRKSFVKNVKGLGLKEASHFLRNIGFGFNLAILDRHILKNLKKLGVIRKIPENLNEKNYLEIEKKFLKFSKKVKIPIVELDLLLWSMETGEVFK